MKTATITKLAAAFIIVAGFLYACTRDYSPRPRAYFRIDYPEKQYQQYEEDCPYHFSYPVYASIHPDTSFDAEPCWKHIYYEPFDAYLHLSYIPVTDFKGFHELREDARTFVYEHTVKASDIRQRHVPIDQKSSGMIFKLYGNTASALQFYATDTNEHYIRGALYFNAPANRDSLDPVIDFLEQDILEFIHSLEWK